MSGAVAHAVSDEIRDILLIAAFFFFFFFLCFGGGGWFWVRGEGCGNTFLIFFLLSPRPDLILKRKSWKYLHLYSAF